MRSLQLVLAALVFAAPAAWAQDTVWKCVGPDGRSQYTNVHRETQGRNCTVVSKEVSVVPMQSPSSKATMGSKFPSVDRETQRARDDARGKILEDEKGQEEKQLAEARAKLAEQEAIRTGNEKNYQRVLDRLKPYKEAVEQHEKNIAAIQKEIDNMK
jgi:hypothetical protein